MFKNYAASSYKEILLQRIRAHSSVWIEWLPAEQLVEGSNPSGPILKTVHKYGFIYIQASNTQVEEN
jgi:hypothetical protein